MKLNILFESLNNNELNRAIELAMGMKDVARPIAVIRAIRQIGYKDMDNKLAKQVLGEMSRRAVMVRSNRKEDNTREKNRREAAKLSDKTSYNDRLQRAIAFAKNEYRNNLGGSAELDTITGFEYAEASANKYGVKYDDVLNGLNFE